MQGTGDFGHKKKSMRNKITFVILRGAGSKVHQIEFMRSVLYGVGLAISLGIVVFSLLAVDYFKMKHAMPGSRLMEQELVRYQEKIKTQNSQIQAFAEEINDLKTRLVALNEFENRIRIIANINQPDDNDGLFGVGGTAPDDLDASKPLRDDHTRLIRTMHEQVAELGQAAAHQSEGFGSLFAKLEEKRDILASTPAIRPWKTGWLTSNFGYRHSPFTGLREFHKGLDVAAPTGTPIYAPADGTVTYSGTRGRLGKAIIINHGHGLTTRYGHCSDLERKKGERVKRGDVIARVGNTGRSTGPHLHYEVRLHGVQVDPKKYILN